MPPDAHSAQDPDEPQAAPAAKAAPGGAPLVDPARVARTLVAPEAGPRIVFLSGGSALRDTSRLLPRYSHNTTHLITPFDSGGSSAPLREAFGMLSVGDLRNRLLALADDGSPEAAAALAAFGHRLGGTGRPSEQVEALRAWSTGADPRVSRLTPPQQALCRESLTTFLAHMPPDFDLRGASIGNLVLTGAYLPGRDIRAALARLGEALGVRGEVLPVADTHVHLAARLADGSRVVGQHRLTGKEHPPLSSPVETLELVSSLDGGAPVRTDASPEALARIREADLICLPMGSFYSSLVCNLLPIGIGRAIAASGAPVVYVPSTGFDPEMTEDPARATERLLAVLRAAAGDAPARARPRLRVLVDPRPEVYHRPPDRALASKLGVAFDAVPLVSETSEPQVDPRTLAELLVSLARPPREGSG